MKNNRESLTNTRAFDGLTLEQLLWPEWKRIVKLLTRKVQLQVRDTTEKK